MVCLKCLWLSQLCLFYQRGLSIRIVVIEYVTTHARTAGAMTNEATEALQATIQKQGEELHQLRARVVELEALLSQAVSRFLFSFLFSLFALLPYLVIPRRPSDRPSTKRPSLHAFPHSRIQSQPNVPSSRRWRRSKRTCLY